MSDFNVPDDDFMVWKNSQILKDFVELNNHLFESPTGEIVEASNDLSRDEIDDMIQVRANEESVKLYKRHLLKDLSSLNSDIEKFASQIEKYNNEKAQYSIDIAYSEIQKLLSMLSDGEW